MKKVKIIGVALVLILAGTVASWIVFSRSQEVPASQDDELLLQAVNEKRPELCNRVKTVLAPDKAQAGKSKGQILSGDDAVDACKQSVKTGHLPGP